MKLIFSKILFITSFFFNALLAQDKCTICEEYKRKGIEEFDNEAFKSYTDECFKTNTVYYKDSTIVESKKQSSTYTEYKTDYCGKFSGVYKYNTKDKSIIEGCSVEDGDTIYSVMDNAEVSSQRMNFIMKHILKNFKYPQEAREKHIEGKVFVQFTLNELGDPIKVYAIKSPDKSLAIESINIIKSIRNLPPVKYRGRYVKVNFVIPINFKID